MALGRGIVVAMSSVMKTARFAEYVAAVALFAIAGAGVGCADPVDGADEAIAKTSAAITAEPCTPAVIVVRHAEDGDCKVGEEDVSYPSRAADGSVVTSTKRVHQRCLTSSGVEHANVYATSLAAEITSTSQNLCPVSKIVTQDPTTLANSGAWPSSNPFLTILPFAKESHVPVVFRDAKTVFGDADRRALLDDASHSTIIAWDKEGMFESEGPLLAKMAKKAPTVTPPRDRFYVFTNMNDEAKFDLTVVQQYFQDRDGYLASCAGKPVDANGFFRFNDGILMRSAKAGANVPALVPNAMMLCEGTTCGGRIGTSLPESARR